MQMSGVDGKTGTHDVPVLHGCESRADMENALRRGEVNALNTRERSSNGKVVCATGIGRQFDVAREIERRKCGGFYPILVSR